MFRNGGKKQATHKPCCSSDALDSDRLLALQLGPIPRLLLLLAVLQPGAVVGLEHAVAAAEVAGAEPAVANDGLGAVLAVLEAAADLLGGAAAEGQGEVHGALARDAVVADGCGEGGQVPAGVDDAQVGLGEVCAEGQQGA